MPTFIHSALRFKTHSIWRRALESRDTTPPNSTPELGFYFRLFLQKKKLDSFLFLVFKCKYVQINRYCHRLASRSLSYKSHISSESELISSRQYFSSILGADLVASLKMIHDVGALCYEWLCLRSVKRTLKSVPGIDSRMTSSEMIWYSILSRQNTSVHLLYVVRGADGCDSVRCFFVHFCHWKMYSMAQCTQQYNVTTCRKCCSKERKM